MCLTPKPILLPLDTHVETSFKEGKPAKHSNLKEISPGILKMIII